jgi:hypothetical protein
MQELQFDEAFDLLWTGKYVWFSGSPRRTGYVSIIDFVTPHEIKTHSEDEIKEMVRKEAVYDFFYSV